jgi:hypothetical protein
MNGKCYYDNNYVEDILLSLLYTDAQIIGKACYYKNSWTEVMHADLEHCFTKNINENALMFSNEIRIKNIFIGSLITNIKMYMNKSFDGLNIYSTDKEGYMEINYKYHYIFSNKILINSVINSYKDNELKIVMCTWNRKENMTKTITCLNIQTYKNFTLYIWNNNKKYRGFIEKEIYKARPKFNVYIYHSDENIGGIGRFYMTTELLKKENFEYVIFIDDDQIFDSNLIENFRTRAQKKYSFNWYGRLFTKGKPYIFRNKETDKKALADGTHLHYGGTGGMIIDTSIFNDQNLYKKFPHKYLFVEDLWLSFYAQKFHRYNFIKINQNIQIIQDKKDQCSSLWDQKNDLLNYCRSLKWLV